MQDEVKGPGQPGGRRLMPGEQQREQLVADLAIGEGGAVLIAGQEQAGEDVVALREVRVGAAAGDLGVDDLVDGALALLEPLRRGALSPPAHHGVEHQHAAGARQRLHHRPQPARELVLVGAWGVTEDRAQDDPQGERLHGLEQRERRADGPAVDLGVGAGAHRVDVGEHPLAVKGGQQQPAVAQMLGAVEQQHRALADDRAQQRVGLAGMQPVARALEELLDRPGVEQHHEPLVKQRPHRDDVAVAPATPLQVTDAAGHEAQRLQPAWERGTGRQGGGDSAHRPIVAHRARGPARSAGLRGL